jgi:hypothetical protein
VQEGGTPQYRGMLTGHAYPDEPQHCSGLLPYCIVTAVTMIAINAKVESMVMKYILDKAYKNAIPRRVSTVVIPCRIALE